MIGRGAQGRPWIFRELENGLRKNPPKTPVAKTELRDIMLGHLREMHRFYGENAGVRVARKHLTWYCKNLAKRRKDFGTGQCASTQHLNKSD